MIRTQAPEPVKPPLPMPPPKDPPDIAPPGRDAPDITFPPMGPVPDPVM